MDFDVSKKEISIFQIHGTATEVLPPNLQLEVINLQCNGMLKGKYKRIYRILIVSF